MKRLVLATSIAFISSAFAVGENMQDLTYFPKANTIIVSSGLERTTTEADVGVGTTNIDSESTIFQVYGKVQYSILDDLHIALTMANESIETEQNIGTRTTTTDSSGMIEPVLNVEYRALENMFGKKINLDIISSYSPGGENAVDATEDDDGNTKRGSDEITIGFKSTMAHKNMEFGFGMLISMIGETETEDATDSSDDYTTDAYNIYTFSLAGQLALSDELSLSMSGNLDLIPEMSSKQKTGEKTTIDSRTGYSFHVGGSFAFTKNFLLGGTIIAGGTTDFESKEKGSFSTSKQEFEDFFYTGITFDAQYRF